MRCQFCGKDTKVVDKRDSYNITRRRRECLYCKKRFTTYERAEINLIVVKKDGRREKFDRQKVLNGIIKSCEKRPVSHDLIITIVNDIETYLRNNEKEIKSSAIGELVMERLRVLDKIAYVRFASVYRNFRDITAFEKEVRLLKTRA